MQNARANNGLMFIVNQLFLLIDGNITLENRIFSADAAQRESNYFTSKDLDLRLDFFESGAIPPCI